MGIQRTEWQAPQSCCARKGVTWLGQLVRIYHEGHKNNIYQIPSTGLFWVELHPPKIHVLELMNVTLIENRVFADLIKIKSFRGRGGPKSNVTHVVIRGKFGHRDVDTQKGCHMKMRWRLEWWVSSPRDTKSFWWLPEATERPGRILPRVFGESTAWPNQHLHFRFLASRIVNFCC